MSGCSYQCNSFSGCYVGVACHIYGNRADLQQGVEVNLPKASTSALSGSSEQVVVSIDQMDRSFLELEIN
jgi:hypothetical protein